MYASLIPPISGLFCPFLAGVICICINNDNWLVIGSDIYHWHMGHKIEKF